MNHLKGRLEICTDGHHRLLIANNTIMKLVNIYNALWKGELKRRKVV